MKNKSKKKMNDKIKPSDKNIKREIIFADIAIIVLGLLMTVFPASSAAIIFRAIGILLSAWGILKLITYFASSNTAVFSSFALVQGSALLGFGVFFIVRPEALEGVLTLVLGVVLLISGVLKLQYAVDFLRLKGELWWVPFAGALVTIGLGALVFFNPFSATKWLMLFIGISFMVNGVWDLLSVLLLSQESKAEKKEDEKEENEKEIALFH